jgi:AraC-like DNA-binding protein
MAVNEPSSLARLALIHLERAARFGVPRAELLRDAKLNEEQLRDPDARIPRSAMVRLWHAVASRTPDAALGMRLGAEVRVREFGLVGYTMAFSKTVGAALKRLTRYDRILSEALVVTLDAKDDATWARVDVEPALRAFRPAADFRLAALLSMCRELAAAPLAPLTVQFPYRRPAEIREYERFYRAPLEFGAVATALLLRNDDLARPTALSDVTLTDYLDRLAEQVLTALGGDDTLRDRVRRVLFSELSEGVPALDRVGRELGLSARTLQRGLRQEGTTFAAVLTQLRQDLAQPLLRDGQLTVAEVAFLLGYQDPSAFQRAFRRWSGRSPRAFRRDPG